MPGTTTTTRKPKPAPSGTTNTVKPGQSSRVVKARAAQAKNQATAAKVDAINSGEAAKAKALAARTAAGKATRRSVREQAAIATEAEPTRDQLITEATALGVKGASAKTKAQLIAAIKLAKNRSPLEESNKIDRAHEQCMALKAWLKGGSIGDKPETPDYDALTRGVVREPGEKRARKAREGGAVRASRARSDRGEQARTVEQSGSKLGVRAKLTDAELDAYIRKVQKANPDSSWFDEREYAYWIEKLAVRRVRFHDAWDAIVGGAKPPAPEPTKPTAKAKATVTPIKKVPAKKPAAKAPAKTATPRRAATSKPRTNKADRQAKLRVAAS